jgi:hypothetical protein
MTRNIGNVELCSTGRASHKGLLRIQDGGRHSQ